MRGQPYRDRVVELYRRDLDLTLLREQLRMTPAQRLEKLARFASFAATLRAAGQRTRTRQRPGGQG